MATDSSVQTEADELLELLQSVREISFSDAAKRLKVPDATVESLATFLEEEGIVSIQYKLTTPYMSLAPQKKEKGAESSMQQFSPSRPAPDDTEPQEEPMHESGSSPAQSGAQPARDGGTPAEYLDTNNTENAAYDFSQKWQGMSSVARIRNASAILGSISKQAQVAFSSPDLVPYAAPVQNDLGAAMRLLGEIERQASQGGGVAVPQELFIELSIRMKSLSQRVAALQLIAEFAPTLPENSSAVIQKIRELSGHRKFEQAEALYALLKRKATEFPRTFYKKELEFDTQLSALNEELFTSFEKDKAERFASVSQQLNAEIGSAHEAVRKGELAHAEEIVRRAKQLLADLPDTNPGQKADFESRILKLAGELLARKKDLHTKSLAEKSAQILSLVSGINAAIARQDAASAAAAYRDAKTVFESLPDTFPDQRIALQSQILAAYQRLSSWYGTYVEQRFALMERDILTNLAEMSAQLKLGQVERAAVLYRTIKASFYALPTGNMQRKIALQRKILEVFSVFKAKYPAAVSKSFSQLQSQIKEELAAAARALSSGDVAMGWNQYHRALELFRRLPLIEVPRRTELRMHLLGLYRTLLQASDQQHVEGLNEEQQDTYQRLLSAIMKFHDSVHQRAFGDLAPQFTLISSLFSELPVRIARADNRIRQEVQMLGKQVELFTLAQRTLSELGAGRAMQASPLARQLARGMQLIRASCQSDEDLFAFLDTVVSRAQSASAYTAALRPRAQAQAPVQQGARPPLQRNREAARIRTAIRAASSVANSPSRSAPGSVPAEVPPLAPAAPASPQAPPPGAAAHPAAPAPPSAPATPAAQPAPQGSGQKSDVLSRIERLRKLAYPTVRMPV